MTRPRDGGFTLIEMLMALSIGAALLVVLFGGVRAGLAAWGRGEARAVALEHSRSLAQMLGRAVAGAYPYRDGTARGRGGIVFDGQPDGMTFVTASPPIPAAIPIAFTAMRVSRDAGGLAVRQLALPSLERLDRLAPVLVDSTVVAMRVRYLGEEADAWTDRWDMSKEDGLPRAVEIQLTTTVGRRVVEEPPLVVPIRVLTP